MHLVFLNQYYPPDVAPTGVMLEALVEGLLRDGHEVTVLCASGGYADGARGSDPAVPMGGESLVREESGMAGPGFVFADHRPGEAGASRSGARGSDPALSMEGESVDRAESGSAIPGLAFADHRPGEAGASRSGFRSSIPDPLSPISSSALRVIRIGATRFGRGAFLGKLIDYLSFYVGVAWKLLVMKPRPDRIVALTTPPYLSVVARLVSRIRGGDHAHWVMDLYPDVMVAHGRLREGGLLQWVFAGDAKWGFGGGRCAAVLTLGPDMAERVGSLMKSDDKVEWVPLWGEGARGSCPAMPMEGESVVREESGLAFPDSAFSDHRPGEAGASRSGARGSDPAMPMEGESVAREESGLAFPGFAFSDHRPGEAGASRSFASIPDPESPVSDLQSTISSAALRAQRGWGDDELVVMYSGNMGLGHRFGEILKVAERMNGEHSTLNIEHSTFFRFVFFGGGKRRVEVEEFMKAHPECRMELHGYVEADLLAAHLESADLHLVSLDPAWTGMMVPSKLQGIFEVGRPVVFIGSESSSIGQWVGESGGGWVVMPGDVEGLMRALESASDRGVLSAKGLAVREFAALNFDRETNVFRVVDILTFGQRNSCFEGFLPD